jgi:hypothetical protein
MMANSLDDPQLALLRDIAKALKHVHLTRGKPQVECRLFFMMALFAFHGGTRKLANELFR